MDGLDPVLLKDTLSQKQQRLVRRLISDGDVLFHLPAESSGSVVGSVVVSPIAMEPDMGLFCGAIAPRSGLPNQKSSGTGSELVRAAISESEKI